MKNTLLLLFLLLPIFGDATKNPQISSLELRRLDGHRERVYFNYDSLGYPSSILQRDAKGEVINLKAINYRNGCLAEVIYLKSKMPVTRIRFVTGTDCRLLSAEVYGQNSSSSGVIFFFYESDRPKSIAIYKPNGARDEYLEVLSYNSDNTPKVTKYFTNSGKTFTIEEERVNERTHKLNAIFGDPKDEKRGYLEFYYDESRNAATVWNSLLMFLLP